MIPYDRGADRLPNPKIRFAFDSPLKGDGFEPSVPGRETVNPIVGDGTPCSKTGADLLGNRKFESISLLRRVYKLSVPLLSKGAIRSPARR